MSSNQNWLQKNSSFLLLSNQYVNSRFVLNQRNILALTNEIISPNIFQSLFTKPQEWLSSIRLYPLNFTVGVKKKLMLGAYESDVLAYDYNPLLDYYNLGEWYCRHEGDYPTFTDFNGFTKIEVFLPYLGFVELMPNDVMNKWVQFRLKVDTLTGEGTYYIGVSNTSIPKPQIPNVVDDEDFRIIGTYTTKLCIDLPIGSTDTADVYRNIIMGAVKGIGTAISSYAMFGAGTGISTSTTTTTKTTSGTYDRFSPTTHRPLKGGTWSRTESGTSERTYDNQSYLKGRAIAETFNTGEQALSAMHISASIDRPNNTTALVNAPTSIKIVVKRPRYKDIGVGYGELYGYPCGKVLDLSTVSGYTEITEVHIEGEAFEQATQSELAQLQDELLNGVIL